MSDPAHIVRENPLLTTAQLYLARGWSIFPISAGGKYDKHPHLVLFDTGHTRHNGEKLLHSWAPLQIERPTPEHLRAWLENPAGKGLAIVTGELSDTFVLDFDGEAGQRLLESLGLRPHVRTGSGGHHVYFRHPGRPVRTLNGKKDSELRAAWPGLDIRGDGGYAILPPSRNNSGPYKQLRSFDELEDISILPPDLAAFLIRVEKPAAARDAVAGPIPRVEAGDRVSSDYLVRQALSFAAMGRNDAGFGLACQLRDNGYSQSEARQIMESYAQQVPGTDTKGKVDPYTRDEAYRTLQSAYSHPARDPSRAPANTGRQGAPLPADSEVRAAAPSSPAPHPDPAPQSAPAVELPDVGAVYLLPPPLVQKLLPLLTEQTGFVVRTPQQAPAEYLATLRREQRPVYVLRSGAELVKRLDKAGAEWHTLQISGADELAPADLLAALPDAAEASVTQHVFGNRDFLLEELPALLDQKAQGKGALYPVGLKDIDEALGGGLYPGLHVLGGVTGGGKTALALHIAESNARAGRPVLFVTFEQSRAELWTRLISPRVGMPLRMFRTGGTPEAPLGGRLLAHEAYQDLADNVAPNLLVFEGDGTSGAQQWGVDRIAAEVRRLRKAFGQSPLVILDYLQRMPSDFDGDKRLKVDDVVMALQVRLGREEQAPVLLLSSLSRGNYGELLPLPLDKRLETFKESGGIEYTAYSATLIYPLSDTSAMMLGLSPAPVPGSPGARLGGGWRYVVLDMVKNREGEAGLQLCLKWWPVAARYEIVKALDVSTMYPDPAASGNRGGGSRR